MRGASPRLTAADVLRGRTPPGAPPPQSAVAFFDQSLGLTRVACIARVNGSYPSPRSLP